MVRGTKARRRDTSTDKGGVGNEAEVKVRCATSGGSVCRLGTELGEPVSIHDVEERVRCQVLGRRGQGVVPINVGIEIAKDKNVVVLADHRDHTLYRATELFVRL